jgi:RHS repeat-associated protein
VYLGAIEIHRTTAGAVDCTRYYTYNGKQIATLKNPGSLTWQAGDLHGTTELSIDASTGSTTRLYTDPFGNPRDTTTWPSSKGFVGGTTDPTGLTHLGAREYDPTTGRFISADPILQPSDPQQANGYSYANNTPTNASDPQRRDQQQTMPRRRLPPRRPGIRRPSAHRHR